MITDSGIPLLRAEGSLKDSRMAKNTGDGFAVLSPATEGMVLSISFAFQEKKQL